MNVKKIYIFLFFFLICSSVLSAQILCGIDVLGRQHPKLVVGKNIALFTSSSALDSNFNHTIDRLAKAANIKLIITSEPYFRTTMPGEDNTELDAMTNAKVIQYSDPMIKLSPDTLDGCEILVIDFQDLGIRFFKNVTIIAQMLELAREAKKQAIVLDRPNPLGGKLVAGPVLKAGLRSRFGVYPIPLIYGMTIGELSLCFNKMFGIGAELTVIGMENYTRNLTYKDTKLHWIPPMDHLPEPSSPLYYAVTGFLGEMGVFSTGVGTTRPFHYILAPWIDGELLSDKLSKLNITGVKFLATTKRPYYGLFAQKEISGVEIAIIDENNFDPFLCSMAILKSLYDLYPEQIPLKNQATAEALDILVGNELMRNGIIAGLDINIINSSIRTEINEFMAKRSQYLIYGE